MKRRNFAPALAAAFACLWAAGASAAPPPPITSTLFPFPGGFTQPASATSAGLALADRWLGEGPFDNPAIAPRNEVEVSPALVHGSRQDLARSNREFDETPAFLDGAGLAVRGGWRGWGFAAYAHQPVTQRGDYAFSQGDPFLNPGTVSAQFTVRERRAGAALSYGRGRHRLGAGIEWTQRDDEYDTEETSGAPTAGTKHAEFSGDAIGFTLGLRSRIGPEGPLGADVGVGFRAIPELECEGRRNQSLLVLEEDVPISVVRASAWEYGVSVRFQLTEASRALASLGGRSGMAWEDRLVYSMLSPTAGFTAASGDASEWKLGLDYHDSRDPWSARFGGGVEIERGVAESRATVLAAGGSWLLDTTRIDLGVTHRSIERADQPRSYDDRVVVSVSQSF